MDEERRKRARRTPTDQIEQERIFPALATIESESDWDEEISSGTGEDSDYSTDDDFNHSDVEFLEDGYNYYSLELEEDDVDPDELSYEELIALGETVGVESRGLSEVEITKHLCRLTCESPANLLIDRCVICQVEYEKGEELVSLHCDHPYHADCITKWLQIKKICPICNNEVSPTGISSIV